MANKHFRPFLWVVIGCGSLAFILFRFADRFRSHRLRLALMVGMALLPRRGSPFRFPVTAHRSQFPIPSSFWSCCFMEARRLLSRFRSLSLVVVVRRPLTRMFNWAPRHFPYDHQQCSGACFWKHCSAADQADNCHVWAGNLHDGAHSIRGQLRHRGDRRCALKTDEPIWQTWRRHYLWTSLTYFAGACAAGFIAALVYFIGVYALSSRCRSLPSSFSLIALTSGTSRRQRPRRPRLKTRRTALHHGAGAHSGTIFQMEKLSALGELASGVAHDFNNTLSGILGRAQLLQRTDDPEKLKRGLDIIIKTAEDGAKQSNGIQDFARQRRPRLRARLSRSRSLRTQARSRARAGRTAPRHQTFTSRSICKSARMGW